MDQKRGTWVSFFFEDPDEDGTERIVFVLGGTHRGGMSEGSLSFTGGVTPTLLDAIAHRVVRWVDFAHKVDVQASFFSRVDAYNTTME